MKKTLNQLKKRNYTRYILEMFLYPSGEMHMGHLRASCIGEFFFNAYKLKGERVFLPNGFDSFGLPAELAAIKNSVHPKEWTDKNINKLKDEFLKFDFPHDWNHTLNTSDFEYYKFDQFIFATLYELGLVYKDKKSTPYCQICDAVLAFEQVDIKGCCWRCKNKVENRITEQWFLRTQLFSQEMYINLNTSLLQDWPLDVISMQKEWLGSFFCLKTDFKFDNRRFKVVNRRLKAEYMCNKFTFNNDNINEFYGCIIDEDDNKIDLNTFLIEFKDRLLQQGILKNIQITPITDECDEERIQIVFISKLNDWCVSRQRLWGTPIPVVECKKCGVYIAPILENIDNCNNFKIIEDYKGFNFTDEYLKIKCFKCGENSKKTRHTMDTFFNSSWYMWRFLEVYTKKNTPFSDVDYNIDLYIGGIEHATMHLIYTRWLNLVLYTCRNQTKVRILVEEPIKKLITQGMVLAKTYYCDSCCNYVKFDTINEEKKCICGGEIIVKVDKMSKSFLNGVSPTEIEGTKEGIKLYMYSLAPMTKSIIWDNNGVKGYDRLINNITSFFTLENINIVENTSFTEVDSIIIKLLEQFKNLVSNLSLNVIVSYLYKIFNLLSKFKNIQKKYIDCFLHLLYMFAPKISLGIFYKLFPNSEEKDFFLIKIKKIDYKQNKQLTELIKVFINQKFFCIVKEEELKTISKVFNRFKNLKIVNVIGEDRKIFFTASEQKEQLEKIFKTLKYLRNLNLFSSINLNLLFDLIGENDEK